MMRIKLFIPCLVDQFFPETAVNMKRVLEKAGCQIEYNPDQTCCGQPAYQAGFWDEAKKLGEKFLKDFSEELPIVSPSAACVGMVKVGYDDLFTNTLHHNRCRAVQGQIFELSEFLIHVLKVDYFGAELETRAVYHDSCSALRSCGIKAEPRQLLQQVAGLELLEAPDAEVCCGYGGHLKERHPEIADAMSAQKVHNALDLGAEAIISTDASCLMQLQRYIDREKLAIRTYHIADVLASGWPNI